MSHLLFEKHYATLQGALRAIATCVYADSAFAANRFRVVQRRCHA